MALRLLRRLGGLLLGLLSSACLVTSVDEFPSPPSTFPYLNGSRATPPLAQVLLVDPISSPPIVFSAYVRSEDAGVPLDARLVADWPRSDNTIELTTLSAGSFSEERQVSFTWDPRASTINGTPLSSGCHAFTLIISHAFSPLSNVPARLEDADSLTWMVFIADRNDPTSLTRFDVSSCPGTQNLPPASAEGSP